MFWDISGSIFSVICLVPYLLQRRDTINNKLAFTAYLVEPMYLVLCFARASFRAYTSYVQTATNIPWGTLCCCCFFVVFFFLQSIRTGPIQCIDKPPTSPARPHHSRCEHPECHRQPTYGNKGDKRPRFCSTHKLAGMYDVIARRCEQEGCMTRAAFNFHGQKAVKYCAAHKLEGMENLKSKCCEVRVTGSVLGAFFFF